jgi:hypothetical protein
MSLTTDYKVTAFDTQIGQLTIQFDCVNYPVLLDLHLDENGCYPEGQVLDEYIRSICPLGVVERVQKISEGVPNESSILSLVQEVAPETVEQTQPRVSEDQYLTPEDKLEMQISIIVQKMVAEMFGATV